MQFKTPFFKCLGPLLFGKPPVCALKAAFESMARCQSLAQLRELFGCYFPAALLAPTSSGDNSRERLFSLEVIFWGFLAQVQTPLGSCREALRKIMAEKRRQAPREQTGAMSASTAGYCSARARIPLQVISRISAHLVERMHKDIPRGALWHGRRVKLVDGASVSMPDTPENQERWPQSSGQKPGCGFPMMKLVGVFCMLTGALIEAATGNETQHESILFKSLWGTLEKGDLVMGDRGYCSFGTLAQLLLRGIDVLMRLPVKKISQAVGAKLPKTESFDEIITWKRPDSAPPSMSAEEFALLPPSISVRVIRYNVAPKGFRTSSVTLVTTVLDASITAQELAALYLQRWGIELHFRELKTFLHMDVLRCKTPHMIERELAMHFVAYNLVRCVMQKAAITFDVELARVSFKGCLDTVRQFANAAQGAENKPKTVAALLDEMLLAIARDLLPHRPGRSEPRAVKRRPKNYQRLTKPRHQMGNLPHRNKVKAKNPKSALS